MSRPRTVMVGVLALIVVSGTVAAATTVVSIHTTATDFNTGSPNGFDVEGSGDAAQLAWRGGTVEGGVTLADQGATDSGSVAYGIDFNPNQPLHGIEVDIDASGYDTVQLRDSGGAVIVDKPTTASTVRIEAPGGLAEGEQYYVTVVDSTGGTVTAAEVDGDGFSSVLSLPGRGWRSGDVNTQYAVERISGIVVQPDTTYVSTDHDASSAIEGVVHFTTIADAEATVTWQGYNGNSWVDVVTQSYTTAGNKSLALSGGYDRWRVQVAATKTSTDTYDIVIEEESVLADNEPPTVDNSAASPQGNPQLTDKPTLSIPVKDPDFATAQGDSVTVSWRLDGTEVATTTINSNQTVEYQPDSQTGQSDWSVVVEDQFGETVTSNTFTFSLPSELNVRNVTRPRTQINDAEIEVRLFRESNDVVFTRTSSTGSISLTDVDAGARYFVKADAPGYYQRRTLLDGIFEQRGIYLLNKSATAATVAFAIEDRTGNFGAGSTIQLERALNTSDTPSGESRYQVVAGAELGSKREFVTTLEQNVRYRVIVQSDAGQERQLGAFTIQQDSRRIDLLISGIDRSFDTTSGPVANTTQTISGSGATRSKTVTFRYVDPTNQTDALTLRVHEAGDPSNVFATTSASSAATPLGTFRYSRTFSGPGANVSLVANYTVERNGRTEQATRPFGADRYPVNLPLGDGWAQIFGIGLLIVVGGIFSVANARIGALVLPAVGYVLIIIGVLDGVVALTSVGVAFAVAVGVNLARGDGGGV